MEKRWVFVTGSAGGIGGAVLRKFASQGYGIYAHARRETEEWKAQLSALSAEYGAEIRPVCFDLTDYGAMEREMGELYRGKGRIDVLVNNAGKMHAGLFLMTEMDMVREVFEVNLFSVMELTQLVARRMIRKKSGCIVNVASVMALDPGMGQCAYGVSKAGLITFTETLAWELGAYGIRVNAVAPGITETRMAENEAAQKGKKLLEEGRGALSRLARPGEIADAIYYLASEEASFVNGEVLRIDGGNHRPFS